MVDFWLLKVGEVYKFDIFHAETRTCTSWYLLETVGAAFVDPNDPEARLPANYIAEADEDLNIDGVIESLTVADPFSIGPEYNLTIYKG